MNHKDIENEKIDFAFGIVVDDVVTFTNTKLTEIGILSQLEDGSSNELSFDVLDAIMAYSAIGKSVILEIQSHHDFDEKQMITDAVCSDFAISLLPPSFNKEMESVPESEWDDYIETVRKYTVEWLNTKSSNIQLIPSSGYIGYMTTEVFNYDPGSLTRDPYTKANFVDLIPSDVSEKLKSILKEDIYNHFGGKEGFEIFAHSMVNAVVDSYKVESK